MSRRPVSLSGLENDLLLNKLIQYFQAKKLPAWLAGGYVRDALLNRASPDIDIVVTGNGDEAARDLACHLNAPCYLLDKKRLAGRIIIRETSGNPPERSIDITGTASGIARDLAKRDFTVNALAVKISPRSDLTVLDFFGGLHDLGSKELVPVSPLIFSKDPVRIWRLFRLSGELGFSVSEKTLETALSYSHKLKRCAGERQKSELVKILHLPGSAAVFEAMRRSGFLKMVFKLTPARIEAVTGNEVRILKKLELLLEDYIKLFSTGAGQGFRSYLGSSTEKSFSRQELLKLSALLLGLENKKLRFPAAGSGRFFIENNVSGGRTEALLTKLRFGRKTIKAASLLTNYRISPLFTTGFEKVPAAERLRFYRDSGREAPGVVLLALASGPGGTLNAGKKVPVGCEAFLQGLAEEYFTIITKKKPLLSGADVRSILELPESPFIGLVLEKLEEARLAGIIKNRAEASLYVKKYYKKSKN